jgi:hypothetical protein
MDKRTFQVGDLVMIADEYARPAHQGLTYRVTKSYRSTSGWNR